MSGTTTDRIYRRHPDVSYTRFGDEMLVVVPRLAWQLVLNGTGARVFELLDGIRSVHEIAAAIAEEYKGAAVEQIAADVNEVLTDLETKGAVERAEIQA